MFATVAQHLSEIEKHAAKLFCFFKESFVEESTKLANKKIIIRLSFGFKVASIFAQRPARVRSIHRESNGFQTTIHYALISKHWHYQR